MDRPTHGGHMDQRATCRLGHNCVRLAVHISLQGANELLLQGNCGTCLPRCMDSVLGGWPEACSPALKCSGALCKPSHAPMLESGRHNANDLHVNFKQERAADITALSADVRHMQEFIVSVQGSLMASSLYQRCNVFECSSDSLYLQPVHHLPHCSSEQLCLDSQADLEHLHGTTHADDIPGITHVFTMDMCSTSWVLQM